MEFTESRPGYSCTASVALSAPVKSSRNVHEIAMAHSFEIGTVTRRVDDENLMAMAARFCAIETLWSDSFNGVGDSSRW